MFLGGKKKKKGSWVWNNIINSRQLLEKCNCWKIGNEIALNVWNALCVPNLEGFRLNPRISSPNNPTWVTKFIL